MRYIIMARWWNGNNWDITIRKVNTKEKVLGAIKLLLVNCPPYQISITDTKQDHS